MSADASLLVSDEKSERVVTDFEKRLSGLPRLERTLENV